LRRRSFHCCGGRARHHQSQSHQHPRPPSVNSEVVTRLQKGAKVTFIEEVPVDKPRKDEPARWAVIKLPEGAKVWVFTGFLDDDHKVKSPRLNLRAGPGENYSVLGRLERGAEVKEIRRMDDWIEIEPPDSARAYVDATFIDRAQAEAGQTIAEAAKPPLEQKPVVYEPPSKPAVTPPTVPPPQPQPAIVPKVEPTVEPPKPVKSDPEPKPAETVAVAETPVAAPAKPEENKPTPPLVTKPAGEVPPPGPVTASGASGPDAPGVSRVLPPVGPVVITPQTIPVTEKRVVRREGLVRSTKFNIQAPTYFELIGERGRILNYISGEKGGFKLKDYNGLRVIVTGEEGIDPRYPTRPLIELETIEIAP